MTFEEILKHLRKGQVVHRGAWAIKGDADPMSGKAIELGSGKFWIADNSHKEYTITTEDILAEDWEVIK